MQAAPLKKAPQAGSELDPPRTGSAPDFWSAAGTILERQRQIPSIQPLAPGRAIPLAPAQERLWILEQSERGAPYYNVNLAWKIEGKLDVAALKASLDFLGRRHEILRTCFPVTPSGPVQRINDSRITLQTVDLRTGIRPGEPSTAESIEADLVTRANDFIRHPFDLATGPLLRAALLRQSETAATLVLVVHQIVFDGASMRVFSRELEQCYRAFSQHQHPELAPLPVKYADFAAWQHQCLALTESDREFWRGELERSYEPLRLPVDRPRQNIGITPGAIASFSLPKELTAPLRRMGAEKGISPFAAFLGVFQAFLGRLTGQHDVLSLVSIAARNQASLRNLVGLVANVLPMRLDLSGNPNLRTLLERSGRVVSAALAHQLLPLTSILEMLPSSHVDIEAPVLQTLVIYNNGQLPVFQFENVTFTPSVVFDNGTSRFDLVLDVADSPQGISGTLKYRSDLFEPQTIAVLLQQWKEFIRQAVDDPDRELASIPVAGDHAAASGGSRNAVMSTPRSGGTSIPVLQSNRFNSLPAHTPSTASATPQESLSAVPALDANGSHAVPRKTAPRTDLERTLAKIWQQIFGVSSLGIHDNFFGLGGHSLIAVRMIAAIEQATGHTLRLCKIFQEPTIARLAHVMESKETAAGSSIVEIQPEGSRPPLFLVHGVGGGMFWGYSNLSRQLGPDQPVYGFKSRGMDGLQEFGRIEDMAAQYVADLRKFQPSGPYYLGGYCFGGNVAYEMARQLREQKQEVALLFLMNCWPNNSSYTRLRFTPVFFAKIFWNFCIRMLYQIRSNAAQPRDFFKWRAAWLLKRIKSMFAPQTAESLAVDDIVDLSSRPEHERKLWRTHVEAWLEYQPLPYDGQIVLFRTRGHPLVCSCDNQMGWGGYAKGGVLVRVCPGDHQSILEEANVSSTGAKLKAILDPLNQTSDSVSRPPSKPQASPETLLIDTSHPPESGLQLSTGI